MPGMGHVERGRPGHWAIRLAHAHPSSAHDAIFHADLDGLLTAPRVQTGHESRARPSGRGDREAGREARRTPARLSRCRSLGVGMLTLVGVLVATAPFAVVFGL